MPHTSAGPQAIHVRLGAGTQHRASPEAQEPSPHFRPRNGGAGSARCSAHRRSISAPCSSVRASLPWRSAPERLSQRAIASSARSPAGSLQELGACWMPWGDPLTRSVLWQLVWSRSHRRDDTAQARPRRDLLTCFDCSFSGQRSRSPAAAQDSGGGRLVQPVVGQLAGAVQGQG